MSEPTKYCKICTNSIDNTIFAKPLQSYICDNCRNLTRVELIKILIDRIEKIESLLTTEKDPNGKS